MGFSDFRFFDLGIIRLVVNDVWWGFIGFRVVGSKGRKEYCKVCFKDGGVCVCT